MALQGNYTKYTLSDHPTETEIVEITYPSELLIDDPNYDRSGETVTKTIPKVVKTPTVYENVVIGLRTLNTYILTNDSEGNKIVNLDFSFRIYKNLEDKENRFDETFIIEIDESHTVDLSTISNLWEHSYNLIKSSQEEGALINI